MNSAPLTLGNSTIVTAFQTTLLHQLLIVLLLVAALTVAWNMLRSAQLRRAIAQRAGAPSAEVVPAFAEPQARRLLRVGFGLIWLLDGILQAQSAMPVGLGTQVMQAAATSSPHWVQRVVNVGVVIWNDHPIEAAVSAVWVQVGIGLWLMVAPRGRWLKAGALVSVAWGLVVWVFGEAFGQVFAPGLTWLFGAPGAVLLYCTAGVLIALPDRSWTTPRIGKVVLGLMGTFFLAMAALQAWPGRGFWQGVVHGGQAGTLVGMVQSMVSTPQPAFLASWVNAFADFDAAHGFAVNLVVVVALATIGAAFCSGRARVVRPAVYAGWLLCAADWVLVEDFGFFGGLGTDPNSMIPIALVFTAGYVALTRVPAADSVPAPEARARVGWSVRARLDPAYAFRILAAGGAALVVALGLAPMAFASINPNADPIITEASNGMPQSTDTVAPPFSLVDQYGRTVSLASLRGKVVAMTFLDPVCTSDCPLIGQEFKLADEHLGAAANDVEFVAIVANPIYRSTFDTTAFDRQEGLTQTSNWRYLTGSLSALSKVWEDYGVEVDTLPAGAMVNHAEVAYVIDASGRTREILSADPGAGTETTESSFVDLLDQEITAVMHQ